MTDVFRNQEGRGQRETCSLEPTAASGKHPPALGFYPLLWPLMRQQLAHMVTDFSRHERRIGSWNML